MERTALLPERGEPEVEPLDEAVDHVRGPAGGHVILEYGDYECPFSRRAYREIQRVERELGGNLRFAFRHFPLTEIHPHALAAARAAEAATRQGRYWEMHEVLYHRQQALGDADLRGYASEIGLEPARFDSDFESEAVLERIRRDVSSGSRPARSRARPRCFSTGLCTEADTTRRRC